METLRPNFHLNLSFSQKIYVSPTKLVGPYHFFFFFLENAEEHDLFLLSKDHINNAGLPDYWWKIRYAGTWYSTFLKHECVISLQVKPFLGNNPSPTHCMQLGGVCCCPEYTGIAPEGDPHKVKGPTRWSEGGQLDVSRCGGAIWRPHKWHPQH